MGGGGNQILIKPIDFVLLFVSMIPAMEKFHLFCKEYNESEANSKLISCLKLENRKTQPVCGWLTSWLAQKSWPCLTVFLSLAVKQSLQIFGVRLSLCDIILLTTVFIWNEHDILGLYSNTFLWPASFLLIDEQDKKLQCICSSECNHEH